MRNGRNPARRNRNIGTSKAGHGQDNRDVIPRSWQDSVYQWKRTPHHHVVSREVAGRSIPFLVEQTLDDHVHACTVDDIATVLNCLPHEYTQDTPDPEFPEERLLGVKGLQGIILRQPTRKEQLLRGAWGRIGWAVDVGPITGPVISLLAHETPTIVRWGKSLSPSDQRELDRLIEMADEVKRDKRGCTLIFELQGIRKVQLYHTLLHEVGHWVDMLSKVELPSLADLESWSALRDRFHQRPHDEIEEFAHRFADDSRNELCDRGLIPFERMANRKSMIAEGLNPADFFAQ